MKKREGERERELGGSLRNYTERKERERGGEERGILCCGKEM